MKKWKKFAAALLASLIFAAAAASPAGAEGFSFNWDSDDNHGSHCKALFLLNLDTDTVAYADNADEPLPMASMTKIMSYIVAYENIPDIENVKITVPQSVEDDLLGTGSSLAGVAVGEELTGLQLLYLMMVPSGNDAALTLSKYVDSLYASGQIKPKDADSLAAQSNEEEPQESFQPEAGSEGQGGESGEEEEPQGVYSYPDSYFVRLMNRKAKDLGCKNTHFTNPHGLHHKDHYASARDMATITKYAMTLPNFTEITGTVAYNKPVTNMSSQVTTKNTTNMLLLNYMDENSGINYYYQSATGIKTGSLDEAGYCLTASATAYGYTYIAVAMGCPMYDEYGNRSYVHGEMLDIRSMFRWAMDALEKKTVAVQGDILSSVSLKYAFQKDELLLAAGENASVMLPKSVDSTSILVTSNVPESVQAPVKKGEQVGTASLSYAGEVIATVPLVAAESVSKSTMMEGWETGKALFASPWFLVILAVIVALVIVYIILIFLYRRKQRQLRKKVRRFREM